MTDPIIIIPFVFSLFYIEINTSKFCRQLNSVTLKRKVNLILLIRVDFPHELNSRKFLPVKLIVIDEISCDSFLSFFIQKNFNFCCNFSQGCIFLFMVFFFIIIIVWIFSYHSLNFFQNLFNFL